MRPSVSSIVLPVGLFLAGCAPKSAEPPELVPVPAQAPTPELVPELVPDDLSATPTRTWNPPPPGRRPVGEPLLPTWDALPSSHPAGATNPPSPVLLMTEDGRCFKQWVSPWLPGNVRSSRVTECPNTDPMVGDCGTQIQCPADAVERTHPKQ